ncbi:hypothetical protein OUZ56_032293, partial [Daphnia magna]
AGVEKYFEPHNASTVSSILVNGSSSSSKLDKGLSGIFIPTSEKVMLYNGNILSEKLCSTP